MKRQKKEPVYKSKVHVLENGLQGRCSCTWQGNILSQQSGLMLAIEAAQTEIKEHIHIQEKK